MDSFATYRELALRLDAAAFARSVDAFFVVKRPRVDGAPSSASAIEFRTTHVRSQSRAAALEGDEFARSWVTLPVRKRPGNPFPDRVSIGRATNCDIVLRVSYVSKVHAHLLIDPSMPLRLADARSANGTWVNGRELTPGEIVGVSSGDALCFGAAELELLSGADMHRLLTSTA